jgi:hypothetical protein
MAGDLGPASHHSREDTETPVDRCQALAEVLQAVKR